MTTAPYVVKKLEDFTPIDILLASMPRICRAEQLAHIENNEEARRFVRALSPLDRFCIGFLYRLGLCDEVEVPPPLEDAEGDEAIAAILEEINRLLEDVQRWNDEELGAVYWLEKFENIWRKRIINGVCAILGYAERLADLQVI